MQSMRSFYVGLLLLAVLAVVLVVFVFSQAPDPGSGRVAVRLKWLHQAQFAGFYAAEGEGYYEAEGLDVTLNPGGVDFPAVRMVSGGAEQFGVTGADQILLARSEGVPVVALAVIYRRTPFVLFAKKASGIKSVSDFRGHTIGVKYGGNEEVTYRAMARKAKLDTTALKEEPVKYDLSRFYDGDIDVWPGYSINEPIVAEAAGHPVTLFRPSDYGLNIYADTLFTTEEMIKKHPDVVQKFVQATLRGWAFALDHPARAIPHVMRFALESTSAHETKMLAASVDLVRPDEKPLGSMSKEGWEELQVLLVAGGTLERSVDIDAAFTTQFIGD